MRALLIVATALLLAACGADAQDDAAPAPTAGGEIAGTTLEGESLALADLRGQPVLVNVWSSW